jgi:hypothetical protein
MVEDLLKLRHRLLMLPASSVCLTTDVDGVHASKEEVEGRRRDGAFVRNVRLQQVDGHGRLVARQRGERAQGRHVRGMSNGRDVMYAGGFALALSGDITRSDALANDLERQYPRDTLVRFTPASRCRRVASRLRLPRRRHSEIDSLDQHLHAAVRLSSAVVLVPCGNRRLVCLGCHT